MKGKQIVRFGLKLLLALLAALGCARAGWSADDEMLEVKGVKIHYTVEGKGAAVVLIHGMDSSAASNWRAPGTIALLAKDYQVIAPDLPGHGKSDKPGNADAYGVQMVEDVVALLDHLQIKKAHIVGYSMGGMVAAKLMARHPDRVLSGILGGMGWLRDGGVLDKVWEWLPVKEGAGTPPMCVHSVARLALTREELEGIKVPVVVLIGDRDPMRQLYVAPLEMVRKDWPVIEIKDAGHVNCIFKAQFKEEIKKWLDDKQPGPKPE
jgi:pimeloyl-ACP methyl ester carboxylesterase